MTQVRPGDLVLSFAKSRIQAIGIVTQQAEPSVKPDFGAAGSNWSRYGWLVQVEFEELPRPTRPKDHIAQLAPLLPTKYSPLSPTGNGYQHVYRTRGAASGPWNSRSGLDRLDDRVPTLVERLDDRVVVVLVDGLVDLLDRLVDSPVDPVQVEVVDDGDDGG